MESAKRVSKQTYKYGDPGFAYRRLRVSADAFSASSRRFLASVVDHSVHLALDLGCGPGYSTRLLAEVLKPNQTIGLDASEPFLSRARSGAPHSISFIRHDVAEVPFPTGPANLIYCRFLLGHLDDAESIVTLWGSQLDHGGLLLLEEVQWISTTNPTISLYFEIVATMLAHQGHNYIDWTRAGDGIRVQGFGAVLQSLPDRGPLRQRANRLSCVSRTVRAASRGFLVHLREVLRHDRFLVRTRGEEVLSRLDADLARLVEASTRRREVHWGVRQVVFERL